MTAVSNINTLMVAIVGTTASGKSGLAMTLAKACQGEIICADSRTIYRGMDIGTAKPTLSDKQTVSHHLLDLIEPTQRYSAHDFKQAASLAASDIGARKKIPLLVGGTGLYAYSLLYNYEFPAGARSAERERLESQPLDVLVNRLHDKDRTLWAQIDLANKRRVIRAIETAGLPRQKAAELSSTMLLIGLDLPNATLVRNIHDRTTQMLASGLEDEVAAIVTNYGREIEALRSPGYAEVLQYLDGAISHDQMQALIELHTLQLAKRQRTWFKRNPDIKWFDDPSRAYDFAVTWLASSTFGKV